MTQTQGDPKSKKKNTKSSSEKKKQEQIAAITERSPRPTFNLVKSMKTWRKKDLNKAIKLFNS